MVIWGYKTVKSKSEKINELTCESCGKTGSIIIQYYQQYYHVFWIPVIPSGKSAIAICAGCGHSIDNDTMNPVYKNVYKKLKPRAPAWMYSGLIFLLIFVGWAFLSEKSNQEEHSAQVNDCRSSITAEKIFQVGITDDYQIDVTSPAGHAHAKLIKIKSVDGNSILYYEGTIIRKASENMTLTNKYDAQFATLKVKSMSLADFEKMEILGCK